MKAPKRHAYLITAYNNFYTLRKLIMLLDDRRNDIFIHIDEKTRDFDFESFRNICNYSDVIFVPRIKVYWGDYSQIQSIFQLLECAIHNKYSYYHLISGVDLPIKTQDQIHNFFAINEGKEFIGFAENFNREWVSKIHILNRYNKSNRFIRLMINELIKKPFLKAQYLIKYDRMRFVSHEIRKGCDWFSISYDFAIHIIKNKKIIGRLFKFSLTPTEFYAHTLIWNSSFKDSIYNIHDEYCSCLRHVDWERGLPYIFRNDDFSEIINSNKFFARKFDDRVDKDIIDNIYSWLMDKQTKS